jgi:hypothetical protein
VTIIDDFYKQSVADMHPAVRRLIEDRLLTKAGYRDNIDLAQARTDLEQAGANSSCLDDLVRLRLLQVEEHRGLPRLELTHDVLADPVKRSRDQWDEEQAREKQRQQQREALAQAKQAEQVAVRKARFLQRVIAAVTLVSVLLAALLVYALKKRSEAQTSEKGEKQAVLDAEQAKAKAERAQTDAERAKADADQAKAAKAEADALTIKQKDGELQMFRQHEADRNSLAKVSLNSLEHCLSVANYFLRLGQEKKSQAWLEVYESFLMEEDQCFGLAQTVHKLMPENLEITDDLTTIPLNAAESARLRADKKKVREYCDSAVNEADRLQNERKDRGTKILAARTYVAAASKLAEVGDETAKAKDDRGMSVVAELRARSTLKDFGDRDWHNLGAVYSYHGDFLTSSKKDPEAVQSYKESFNAEVNAHTRKPRDKAKDKEYEAAALKLAITIGDYEKRLGDNDAAMQWYEKTPKFAHESDDRAKIAHVYSDMRTALIAGKKYDEAHAFIDRRIHSLATDPQGPSREQDLAMAYGDAAEVEEARRWWPQAVDYRARAVMVLAPVETDDAYVGVRKDLAIAYRDLSWAEIFAGQVEKGLADTRKGIAVAEEIAEEIRDRSTVVPLHENNMDARLRSAVANNSQDGAHDPDGVTQKPAKESKDRSILGLVYTDAITVLSANEHYDEAHQLSDQYLAALLKEPQDVQRDRQLAAAYGRAAGIEENRKQWPLAVDYRAHAVMVLAALKTNAYEGVSKDLAIAHSVLSWDEIYAGQVEKGLADAQEGIAGAEETLDHFTLGDVYANAIRPLVANKRYSDARNLSDRLFQTLLKEPQDLERDWALQAACGDSVRIDQATEDWPRAVEDYKQQVSILTALNQTYTYEIIQKDLASAYGGLSWAEIQAGRFAEGRDDAKRGLAKDPTQTWINVKLAHGLLLTGEGSDARDLYLKIRDYPRGNNTLLADIAGDFKQLCKLGKAPPEMLSIAHDLGINDPELSKCSASVAGSK